MNLKNEPTGNGGRHEYNADEYDTASDSPQLTFRVQDLIYWAWTAAGLEERRARVCLRFYGEEETATRCDARARTHNGLQAETFNHDTAESALGRLTGILAAVELLPPDWLKTTCAELDDNGQASDLTPEVPS